MLFLMLYIQGDMHIPANNMSSEFPHTAPLVENLSRGKTCPQDESDMNKLRLPRFNKPDIHPC